jgi:hypothetical protein
MISLPVKPSPNSMSPELVDRGFFQRGAATLRVEKPGSHFKFTFSFPPMKVEQANSFTTKLLRAKRKGLRVYLPLRIGQGIPGTPLVDGAVTAAAETLAIKGLTPGYILREGYWITVVEADGSAYVHNVFETVVADASGDATVEIEPPLRAPFADGDTIHIGKPFVDGFMESETIRWDVTSDDFVVLTITFEEYR